MNNFFTLVIGTLTGGFLTMMLVPWNEPVEQRDAAPISHEWMGVQEETLFLDEDVPAEVEHSDALQEILEFASWKGHDPSDLQFEVLEAIRRNQELDTAGVLTWELMFALGRSEGFPKGKEFGVLLPKARKSLRDQAGWCAATIARNGARWREAGYPGTFIEFLGSRYAPIGADNDPEGLNENWVTNVTRWHNRLTGKEAN